VDDINNGTILTWSGGGSVIVNSGTLTFSNSGAIGSTTAGGIGSNLSCSDLNMTGGTFTNINTGTVEGTGTSSFGAAAFPNTLEISGGTLLNQNSGTVVNSNLNFGAVVSAIVSVDIGSPGGTLINNALLQSPIINVSSGGTLAGTGTYTGFNDLPTLSVTTDVTSSGNVEPFNGVSPGTMTISGSYIQTAQGTFTADLLNSSTFSQLHTIVNGTTALAGTLNVNFLPNNTVSVNDTFVIIATTTNDLTGTFSTVTTNSPNLIPHVTYIFGFDGEVILSFTAAMPTTYAGGFIETVLSDINHLNSHTLLRMEDLRRNFSNSSQNHFASLANLTASNTIALQWEKQEQLRREVVNPEKTAPARIYFGPVARSSAVVHTKDDQPGLEFWSIGGLIGFDYAFSQVGIGIMSEYERITAHAKQNWGKIEVDQFYTCFYTTYAPECLPELAVNAIVGGAYEKYYINRNTGTNGHPLVAKGKPSGFGVDGLLGLEYVFGKCFFHFIPLANAQYIYLRANHYKEHGAGGFDLNVGHQIGQSLRSSLGARLNYLFQKDNLIFIPEIYGSWQREYMNKHRHIGIALADLSLAGETLLMPGTSRNIALGGADLLFTICRFSIEGNYEFEYNGLYHDHFFYVGVDFRF
ncbi:MAG TPA: autotransporter domain-containing protein, partial [Chlamydiales bacterium]|nr:autotransporter domain-containing protein [Chlamydiales bacterium]